MFSVVSVCLSIYLSVCPSVQTITFELLHIETSFLVCRYIFTISRSILSIKVIGSRSRSYEKNYNFTYFNMLNIYIWLQVFNEFKITHQGEGHIKVKVKISTSFPVLCQILLISTYYSSVCGYKSLIRSSSYIKVKAKYLHPFKFYVPHIFCKRVVFIRLNAFLLHILRYGTSLYRLFNTRKGQIFCLKFKKFYLSQETIWLWI